MTRLYNNPTGWLIEMPRLVAFSLLTSHFFLSGLNYVLLNICLSLVTMVMFIYFDFGVDTWDLYEDYCTHDGYGKKLERMLYADRLEISSKNRMRLARNLPVNIIKSPFIILITIAMVFWWVLNYEETFASGSSNTYSSFNDPKNNLPGGSDYYTHKPFRQSVVHKEFLPKEEPEEKKTSWTPIFYKKKMRCYLAKVEKTENNMTGIKFISGNFNIKDDGEIFVEPKMNP